MADAIVTKSLCKQFPVGENRLTAFKRLSNLWRGKYRKREYLDAFSEINLRVRKGSRIALIGNNGAGKSTLLRTIAGIYAPTRGSVSIQGSLVLLAGWGTGLVDTLTVRKNVYLLGAIYGMYRHEVDRYYRDIISWAELERFESNQLFTLSTGMRTRLAFSTIRHVNADIFLLDEAFSAGDQNFKKKCNAHFEQAGKSDRTYIIATHNPESLSFFCNETMWLDNGRIIAFGPSEKVIKDYHAGMRS